MVLFLKFEFLIHVKFILTYGIQNKPSFAFLYKAVHLFQQHLFWKFCFSFPWWFVLLPISYSKFTYVKLVRQIKEKTEKDTNKWKTILCSWIRRTNIVKMCILLKVIYRFNVIPVKTPMALFMERKNFLKFVGAQKRSLTAKAILRKKNKAGKDHTSWLHTILQSYSNQNGMVLW